MILNYIIKYFLLLKIRSLKHQILKSIIIKLKLFSNFAQ